MQGTGTNQSIKPGKKKKSTGLEVKRICSGAVVYLYGAGGFQSTWGVITPGGTSGELDTIAAHPVARHTQGFDGSSIIS